MTSLAIVGSCQVVGLRAAAQQYLGDATIKVWHVYAGEGSLPEQIAPLLPQYDFVITQFNGDELLSLRKLTEAGVNAIYLPVVAFRGFHPDQIYVIDREQNMVRIDGFGDYHSAVILSACLSGLSQARTLRLFNAAVFAELGYFDVFNAARAALIRNFAEAGYDIGGEFEAWLGSLGQFMHTINHPHVGVLAPLARLALIKCGLIDAGAPHPDVLPTDQLRVQLVWPTYPALAARIGVAGGFDVLGKGAHDRPDDARRVGLADVIARSFEVYRDLKPERLTPPALRALAKLQAILAARTYAA